MMYPSFCALLRTNARQGVHDHGSAESMSVACSLIGRESSRLPITKSYRVELVIVSHSVLLDTALGQVQAEQ
jgi:hypothetical protein